MGLDECAKQYAPLVQTIARKISRTLPANQRLDDLIQAGMIGLIGAHRNYRSSKGAQFAPYAGQRIRGAILDSLRAASWMPRGHRDLSRVVESTRTRLENQHLRRATDGDVAKALGTTLPALRKALQPSRIVPIADHHDVADWSSDPLTVLLNEEARAVIIHEIAGLPDRDRKVITMRYRDRKPLKVIGRSLGVGEARACQLVQGAVKMLRDRISKGVSP